MSPRRHDSHTPSSPAPKWKHSSKYPLHDGLTWRGSHGARAILATGTSGDAMGRLVAGLAARGKLIVVGAPEDRIQLDAIPLTFGGRSVYGSLTGTPIDIEDALAFSVLENIRPLIETAPLDQAANAYARMMDGKARFRMVLVTHDGGPQRA